jgi:hypothetical protein
MKILAIVVFLLILVSLGKALYHLVKAKDDAESAKIAKALTVRIGVSLVLFILIFIAFATGMFQPQGIGARIEQSQYENSLKQK